MQKKIIGKVHIKDIGQITRQYYESVLIPWAKDICENHLDELWSEKGNGSGYGYEESIICKVFRTQFEISGPNYKKFPDLESNSTCNYCGYNESYLNGSMTVKERIIRSTVKMLEDIAEFSKVYGKEPVFELLSSGISDETEQKLNIALLGFGTKQFCLPRTLIEIELYLDGIYSR